MIKIFVSGAILLLKSKEQLTFSHKNGFMYFTFQPASMEVKKRWAKEITNLLQSQFNQVKGTCI